ncbi:DJ-1/PfpI family protein [Blautia schinkii]|nr:DJ-1/PfpI family protein [Blautia schinkii]
MSKTYIFLADGFEEVEGLTAVDLLRRAGVTIETVSIKDSREIEGSHGIALLADRVFQDTDFSDAEMLILPGGMPGTAYLRAYKPLADLLKSFYNKGGKIAAICAAPGVLGTLGFLKGRRATSYPGCLDQSSGAEICQESVVVDGNVTTSRGVGTAIDFALCLIEQLKGKQKADEIAESIIFSR